MRWRDVDEFRARDGMLLRCCDCESSSTPTMQTLEPETHSGSNKIRGHSPVNHGRVSGYTAETGRFVVCDVHWPDGVNVTPIANTGRFSQML